MFKLVIYYFFNPRYHILNGKTICWGYLSRANCWFVNWLSNSTNKPYIDFFYTRNILRNLVSYSITKEIVDLSHVTNRIFSGSGLR